MRITCNGDGTCIIRAGSGICTGGRIEHHRVRAEARQIQGPAAPAGRDAEVPRCGHEIELSGACAGWHPERRDWGRLLHNPASPATDAEAQAPCSSR